MILLFVFEFAEGNTVTRRYFTRLRRATEAAVTAGRATPALTQMRAQSAATFTHFLDLPILLLIVSLGVLRPDGWAHFFVGAAAAVAAALALTIALPRIYTGDPTDSAARP